MDHTIFTKTRLPTDKAVTLDPDFYRKTELYEYESDKLFGESWVCVGYTCDVDRPGKILRASINNQPIVITRNKAGELKGFYNVCRHRGSLLVLHDNKLERFRCPYHSWTYDLDGNLTNCPLFVSDDFTRSDYNLLPIQIASYGCFIFACLSRDSNNKQSLLDYLGDLPKYYKNFPLEELVVVRRKKYIINANWKLVAENFLEYYHLPWVHPELCEVMPIDMHKRNQGAGMFLSFYASPLSRTGSALDSDALCPMPGLSKEQLQSGYFPFVFPNLALFLLPHHVFSLILSPNSINQTHESGDLLVHPSIFNDPAAQKKLDEIFAFYDMVNLQDIVAVERVQLGIMAKGYAGGRMCYRFEEPVHRFQNMVIDYLCSEKNNYKAD